LFRASRVRTAHTFGTHTEIEKEKCQSCMRKQSAGFGKGPIRTFVPAVVV